MAYLNCCPLFPTGQTVRSLMTLTFITNPILFKHHVCYISNFRTTVLLGVTKLSSIRDSTKSVFEIDESSVKIHPGYRNVAYHDLAIAKLDRAIPASFTEVYHPLIKHFLIQQ